MKNEVQFTSVGKDHFHNGQEIRAFLYTNYSIPPHNHNFYEMNIVTRGTGMHTIENASFAVKRGDVFFIPPKAVHAYYDTKGLDLYHILLLPAFIAKNMEEAVAMPGFLRLVEIEPFLRPQCHAPMFLHLSEGELASLTEEIAEIKDGGIFDTEAFLPFKKHAMWRILYRLSYLFSVQSEKEKEKENGKYEQCIMHALEYMQTHYNEKITLERLCREVYLSRATFLRHFRAFCGMSPMQYLGMYRKRKARLFMENQSGSKTEIAQKCGFYDLSHMERSMKKSKSSC